MFTAFMYLFVYLSLYNFFKLIAYNFCKLTDMTLELYNNNDVHLKVYCQRQIE